jgi:hypothetical protein
MGQSSHHVLSSACSVYQPSNVIVTTLSKRSENCSWSCNNGQCACLYIQRRQFDPLPKPYLTRGYMSGIAVHLLVIWGSILCSEVRYHNRRFCSSSHTLHANVGFQGASDVDFHIFFISSFTINHSSLIAILKLCSAKSVVKKRENNTELHGSRFFFIIIWFVRLLALLPLLPYCASLGG